MAALYLQSWGLLKLAEQTIEDLDRSFNYVSYIESKRKLVELSSREILKNRETLGKSKSQ